MLMNYVYTKSLYEPLIFLECVQLLDKLVEEGYIQKDPENKNNILVYRQAGAKYPAGWYSENLMAAAGDLMRDEEGQRVLRKTLDDDGIEMQFREVVGAVKELFDLF